MTMQTIESDDLSVAKLFSDFYVVPSYQREYVWEADKQVDRLLQDINMEYSPNGPVNDSEYFIGSTVVCSTDDETFEVIDGQQRMTTAFLVLCAIRDYLKELKAPEIEELKHLIASATVNRRGEDEFRYRVALQYEDSRDVLKRIGDPLDDRNIPKSTRSITNIIEAYEAILAFLRNEFPDDQAAVRAFYAYFTKSVKLIRVRTISVAHALKVFETVNDRGVSLNSMDLLKNLLFMQTDRSKYDELNGVWEQLVKTLYDAGEKPLRFLRYFIFSTYELGPLEDRLRENDIYKWFVNNKAKCDYETNPIGFAKQLLDAARTYADFIGGKDLDGNNNRYLRNISHLSGSARQHLILLLAGRNLPRELFGDLCKQIENLFFAYIIAREPTKEFERSFVHWAPALRNVQDRQGFDDFVAANIASSKSSLSQRFALAMHELGEYKIQRYRLRYILAKITQHINEAALGSTQELSDFLSSTIDVEHILPQNPGIEVCKAFGEPDDSREFFTRRLGNLTLVEKTIDCSIGNGLFQKKQLAYKHSKFLLTESLSGQLSVGTNTQYNRAVEPLLVFDEWTPSSIENRQDMLVRLAHKVWDMPVPEASTP